MKEHGGKAFGFILGAALGGPIGAGVGTFIGSLIDDDSQDSNQKPEGFFLATSEGNVILQCPHCISGATVNTYGSDWNCPSCKNDFHFEVGFSEIQKAKEGNIKNGSLGTYCIFHILGSLAKADGKVTPGEIAYVEAIIKELGFNQEGINICKEAFKKGKDEGDYEFTARTFTNIYCDDQEAMLMFLIDLIKLAHSDGDYSFSERRIIEDIAFNIMEVNKQFYQDLLANIKNEGESNYNNSGNIAEAYAILGCTPSSTQAEIKAKYRELSLKYHPDTISGKDLPEEFIEFAKVKFQEVNQAYETVIATYQKAAA